MSWFFVFLTTLCFGLSNPAFDEYLTPRHLEKRSSITGIDCVYLINLKTYPKRRARIEALLQDHGIDYTYFDAVNGWELFDRQQSTLIKKGVIQTISHPYAKYSPGRLGCYLSHYMIYKDAYEKGYERIWILEDDINIVGSMTYLEELLTYIDKEAPGWDVFYTYAYHPSNHKDAIQPLSEHFFLAQGWFVCTCSMIISRNGIENILEYLCSRPYQMPIDCIAISGKDAKLLRVAPKQNIVVHIHQIGCTSTNRKEK